MVTKLDGIVAIHLNIQSILEMDKPQKKEIKKNKWEKPGKWV